MIMSKVSSVSQQPGGSPGDYCERLCEACRNYSPIDPESPESQWMVNTSFVAQAAPDIREKLQKLEGFAGTNITQPTENATKVYLNREVQADREAERRKNEEKGQSPGSHPKRKR